MVKDIQWIQLNSTSWTARLGELICLNVYHIHGKFKAVVQGCGQPITSENIADLAIAKLVAQNLLEQEIERFYIPHSICDKILQILDGYPKGLLVLDIAHAMGYWNSSALGGYMRSLVDQELVLKIPLTKEEKSSRRSPGKKPQFKFMLAKFYQPDMKAAA
ncbi:MAG TPA: hypothetical protein VK184_05425 [Nostocaceae cyanobacterium]|nr:hypothetical protein [Nostocaceae cyanobacterium]